MIKNVLWTGGWDSTYRVLDLVVNKKKSVQPYYIVDERRKSTNMELKTMEIIRRKVKELDEEASQRILENIKIARKNIKENDKITELYKTLSSQSHLGDQYDWLARYTNSIGISDLELCIHVDDTVEGFINKDIELVEENNDKYYKLIENHSKPELSIFSYYHYPLFDMTKIEMGEQAKESGFDNIMEMTWFCHSPISTKPCGMCNPCKYTRDEGLGRRVPNPTILMKLNRKTKAKWNGLKRRLNLN